jgi:hypothetical protein
LCHARVLGAPARVSSRAFFSHVRRHSLDVPLGALVFAMLRERFRVIVVVCDCFALVRIS